MSRFESNHKNSLRLSPVKLVVGECSPSILKALEMAFPKEEFEIYPCTDGAQVERALGKIDPDVILLNLSLPLKDGYEVARHIKRRKKFEKTPLILLKGAFHALEKERIADLEYDEIVQEPFDSEKLVQIVRGILEQGEDPETLPEEPILDGTSTHDFGDEFDVKVTEVVRKEMLGVESKLRDKIETRILGELKEYIDQVTQGRRGIKKKKKTRNA